MSPKLLDDENALENEIENFVPVSGEKKKKIEKIITSAKKDRAISLRISSYDLEKLKEKACNEGVPYQTLINSILHKYINNRLFEKDEMLKFVRLMKDKVQT